jgi:signal transduction histidine kinase
MEFHPEPSPPAALVSHAIQNVRKESKNPIDYVTQAAPGLPPAFVDPYRTVQALSNVVLFASERVHQGSLELTLRQGQSDRGRMIFIRVTAPVRAATAEQLRQALRGFHRIPGHRGLGLGLPLAGSILELQGGSLGIEDTGEGTAFQIQLPAPEPTRTLRIAGEGGPPR